jgi:hypothetical protein
MKFVEDSEGAFSAAQLAAAERELEEQKKEWELDRLRALREEEERRMRLADDDEKPLTFGREDAQNQVNSTTAKGGIKRLVRKRLVVPSRRSSRRRGGGRRGAVARESSESETETTSTESDSESESQEEDVIEDSLDEESSHTESQSQGDEGEEEEGEGGEGSGKEKGDGNEEEEEEEKADGGGRQYGKTNNPMSNDSKRGGGFTRRKGRLAGSRSCSRNHFDLNSPRTRSRGNVQINLWTLDVSPILPGVKPNFRRQRKKFHRAKFEEILSSSSIDACPKRGVRINESSKVSSVDISDQNLKSELTDNITRVDRDSTSCSFDLNGMKQRVINPNIELHIDNHANSTDKTQPDQTIKWELNANNAEENENKDEKEKSNEKVTNDTNLITVCSVQVTRCLQKVPSAIYRKLNSEVNRNEDTENLDVNTRNSRSSPSSTQSDVFLKRSKEAKEAKSKSEFGVSVNPLYNNARAKPIAAASREPEKNIEFPLDRSIPVLRSKTSQSENAENHISDEKSLTSRFISITQKNFKTNVNTDDIHDDVIENCNENCDDPIDLPISIAARKYPNQKFNSKNETHECLDSEFSFEKKSDDSISNTSDFSGSTIKSETNLNECKYKMRKSDATIPRGVTTRSSKTPSIINNHSEENSERLLDDKIDTIALETKNNSQKTSTRKIDNSQYSILEQSRITRSTGRPLTPSTSIDSDEITHPSKLIPRRRPDTPVPRPITRSERKIIINSPTRIDGISSSRNEKYATRNSKQCQDNGLLSPPVLLRRSRSIPLIKPDAKETILVSTRRRPDTPRPNVPPNNEIVSRVTRSGLNLNSSGSAAVKSASLSSCAASMIKISARQPRVSPTSSENENNAAVSCEKPQRTAKVVAILTLDTRNNHNSNKTFSIQSKSAINCEVKDKDKEHLVTQLSDSLKSQETDQEDSSDFKSRRLRRETKRNRLYLLDNENDIDDNCDADIALKKHRSSQLPSSPSATVITATTRSEKLRSATIS